MTSTSPASGLARGLALGDLPYFTRAPQGPLWDRPSPYAPAEGVLASQGRGSPPSYCASPGVSSRLPRGLLPKGLPRASLRPASFPVCTEGAVSRTPHRYITSSERAPPPLPCLTCHPLAVGALWAAPAATVMASAAAVDCLRHFSYAELEDATAGFASANLIGKGGFGQVFRGTLPEGTPVAVKRIKAEALQVHNHAKLHKDFLKEALLMNMASRDAVTIAGGHRPLLPMLGICEEDITKLCLVMPLMAGGSLADHISERPKGALLNGHQRVAAALDAARGVAALHALKMQHASQPRVLHRDVKPENVLLDGELRAYVADYGLSRLLPGDATSVYSGIYGTPGYVAPETLAQGRYSEQVRGEGGDRGKEGGGSYQVYEAQTVICTRNGSSWSLF